MTIQNRVPKSEPYFFQKNYNFLKASNGQAAKYPPPDLIRFSIVTDMKKLRVILPSCRLHGVFLSYVSYRI